MRRSISSSSQEPVWLLRRYGKAITLMRNCWVFRSRHLHSGQAVLVFPQIFQSYWHDAWEKGHSQSFNRLSSLFSCKASTYLPFLNLYACLHPMSSHSTRECTLDIILSFDIINCAKRRHMPSNSIEHVTSWRLPTTLLDITSYRSHIHH